MLASLIDFFVHPRLRLDPDRLLRVRILIAVLLTLVVQETVVLLVLVAHFPLNAVVFGGSLTLLSIASSSFLLVRLRSAASYFFCSVAVALTTLSLVMIGIGVSGGLGESPVTQMLVAPVLMTFFFGGIRWGAYMTAVVLLLALAFAAAQWCGVHFLQTIAVSQMNNTRLLISVINFNFVCGLAVAYEYTALGLRRERDGEHAKYMHLSTIDPLTGLPNRRNFDAMLHERMQVQCDPTSSQQFVLGYLDLNGFKPINDQFGHAVGDEVLRAVSGRLQGALRGSEFVGRYGGDEFMLLLDSQSSLFNLELVSQRLLSLIGEPIATSKGAVSVGASIGFAVFTQDGGDMDTLKQAADIAMYEAKRAKKGWCFYTPELKAAALAAGT